jgi:hypothetical protein
MGKNLNHAGKHARVKGKTSPRAKAATVLLTILESLFIGIFSKVYLFEQFRLGTKERTGLIQ